MHQHVRLDTGQHISGKRQEAFDRVTSSHYCSRILRHDGLRKPTSEVSGFILWMPDVGIPYASRCPQNSINIGARIGASSCLLRSEFNC
jgi:hypothetical protein